MIRDVRVYGSGREGILVGEKISIQKESVKILSDACLANVTIPPSR
jgi:hypothetical protein